MNSSDDAYEGFRGFSLHHVLGGSKELDILHRRVWEGITRQFTRYGQIYREFDGNWDWMHHGEGYLSCYPLGMADPHDKAFRDRSIRFAAMYTGEDSEAPNYDPERRLIVQGGAYGEHRIRDVWYQAAASGRAPGSDPPGAGATENRTAPVNGTCFRVDLEPGTGITLKIGLDRFVSTPRYALPWDRRE